MNALKTDDEHLVFLKSLAALKVRFALTWSARYPENRFSRALTEKTFFINLGVWHQGELYDHPQVDEADQVSWERFLSRADALADGPDAEEAILALLPPDEDYFVPRVARDQAELHHRDRGLAARTGCLWTMAVPEALSLPEDPSAPRILEFHIANHKYPESFLKDGDAVRGEIRALALRARDLGFAAIGTRTWLNDVPAWLRCFPEVWSHRRTPQDETAVGGHLGCWGQTVTARQTLSSHADTYLRTHSRFEFAMRASWITVDEALA